jgi:hypothetical protein
VFRDAESGDGDARATLAQQDQISSQSPSGFIHLILLSQEDPLYLEIPTAIVKEVCLKPRKYLRYLGWCILGVIGDVSDEQGTSLRWMASWLIRASTTTLCQIKTSSPTPLTLRSSSNDPKFHPKLVREPAKTFAPRLWNAMVVASGPVCPGLGYMSSRTDEGMRHVHITCPVCELN